VVNLPEVQYPPEFYNTVSLARPISGRDLEVAISGDAKWVEVRTLGITNGSLIASEERRTLRVADGRCLIDVNGDVLPIVMIDRHRKGTGIGRGFVTGFGLKAGAFATSVNAMCENILIVGTDLDDMALAANTLEEVGGGKVVVVNGEVRALVELPLLGLLSEDPISTAIEKFELAIEVIRELGCELDYPFSQLEFCGACGSLGDIKISEEGLVSPTQSEKLDLIVGTS
jgi:adenine deaminase